MIGKSVADELVGVWRGSHVGFQLHHVYGKVGRLRYCRLFWFPLTVEENTSHQAGSLTRRLRESYRPWFQKFEKANWQNRDDGTCWYVECPMREWCPLQEQPPL